MAEIKKIRDREYLVMEGLKLVAKLKFVDNPRGEWQLIDYCIPGCFGDPTRVEKTYENEAAAVIDLCLGYPHQTIYQTSCRLELKS